MSDKKESTLDKIEENLEHLEENIEAFEKKLGFFHPVNLLATWFGAGKSKIMPGTVGSIAALPFAYFIQAYAGAQGLMLAALLAFLIGVFVSEQFMKLSFTSHDPKEIVIDEVAGMWLLLVAFPPTLNSYIFALLLFRAFDIVKPWPVSICDSKVLGGFGVMLDDFAAAVYPVILMGLLAMFCAVMNFTFLEEFFSFLGQNAF